MIRPGEVFYFECGKASGMGGPKRVFTNGCFDLLHPGHVDLLERARALGDRLIVGLNSDASVRDIKALTSHTSTRKTAAACFWPCDRSTK